jgi:hypothetical protein
MKAALVAALAVLAAATVGCGGSHPRVEKASPPPPPGPARLAEIRQFVLREARKMGDPGPTHGLLVPTTRRLAELTDLDTDEPDAPVYLVLVHGKFRRGTLLTLTIDPRSNKPITSGLVGAMPDLNAIGKPQPLGLG